MTRTLAYRHFQEAVVHLYRDCPEGKLIGISRRDAVTDRTQLGTRAVRVRAKRAGGGGGLSRFGSDPHI